MNGGLHHTKSRNYKVTLQFEVKVTWSLLGCRSTERAHTDGNTVSAIGNATEISVTHGSACFVLLGFSWGHIERDSADSIPWCAESLGENTRKDGCSRPITEQIEAKNRSVGERRWLERK